MVQHQIFFFEPRQFAHDVFAADLALVGAGEQFGGVLLGAAVFAAVLLLLPDEGAVLRFGGFGGGAGLVLRGFGGGQLGGEGFKRGGEVVQTRFLRHQAFLRGLGVKQNADFVDLVAFGREPDLAGSQVGLVREGVVEIGGAQYAVEPVVQGGLKRRLRLDLV